MRSKRYVRTVLEELGLNEGRMALDLVHGGYDPCSLDDLFQHLDRKVRNTNSLDLLGLLGESNEFSPGSGNTRSIGIDSLLAIRTVGCELLSWLERYWPMDQVNV